MENTVSERIKMLRTQLNLSQNEFANKVGASIMTVSRWETGHAIPKKNLYKINQTFGVSMQWLETGAGEMNISMHSETKTVDNPWRDALVEQLNDEIQFLRNALKLALGGKEANFLNAFDLAVPGVASKYVGIMPQMEIKSVSGAA